MNHHQTIEKLRQMRLTAMANLHLRQVTENQQDRFTPDEYLALLTDHEWEDRQNRKIQRLLSQAGFRQQASLAQVDHHTQRNLDRNAFGRLATLDFIKRKENIILTGASGVGKSYLAQALGQQACMMGLAVGYCNTGRLLNRLKLAKVDGTYLKELAKLGKTTLLVLDDFGLQAFDNLAREALMDIVEDRHNRQSTIVASQIPVSAWHGLIGEGTIADAILDRLVNSSHRIDLKGDSMRKGTLKDE